MKLSRIAKMAAPLAALLVAGTFGAKQAAATPSTLGFYPSTDIYGNGVNHLDVDTYGVALKTDVANTVGLTRGFGTQDKAFGRGEIGFDYVTNASSTDTEDRLLGNAKVLLYNNNDNGTRLVAGGWLLGTDDAFGANVIYAAASKSFKFGRITAGIAHALEDDNIGGDDADETFLHLGYDRALSSRLLFAVDFYSGDSAISGVQPTLYYSVNDRASFGLGLFRLNDDFGGSYRKNQTYVCFDYNFGGGVDSPSQETAPSQGQPGAPGEATPAPATP